MQRLRWIHQKAKPHNPDYENNSPFSRMIGALDNMAAGGCLRREFVLSDEAAVAVWLLTVTPPLRIRRLFWRR